MARFVKKKRSTGKFWIRVLSAVAILVLFVLGIRLVSTGDISRQERNLQQVLETDITACYALEGRYPESLDYLKQNYGLMYNEKLFYVDYQVTGTNIRPVVTVVRRDDEEQNDSVQQ